AAGDNGTVVLTGDGFSHWAAASVDSTNGASAIPTQFATSLNGVSCRTSTACLAVGSRGTVASIDTKGSSPTVSSRTLPAAGGQTLQAVSCSDSSHCTAVGGAGTIVSTSDGEGTWGAVTPTSELLDGVSCPNVGERYAAGAAGTLIATGDGGATWTAAGTGTTKGLRSVACRAATCFEVGESGVILSTAAPQSSTTSSTTTSTSTSTSTTSTSTSTSTTSTS